jgi:hypothetical protein
MQWAMMTLANRAVAKNNTYLILLRGADNQLPFFCPHKYILVSNNATASIFIRNIKFKVD